MGVVKLSTVELVVRTRHRLSLQKVMHSFKECIAPTSYLVKPMAPFLGSIPQCNPVRNSQQRHSSFPSPTTRGGVWTNSGRRQRHRRRRLGSNRRLADGRTGLSAAHNRRQRARPRRGRPDEPRESGEAAHDRGDAAHDRTNEARKRRDVVSGGLRKVLDPCRSCQSHSLRQDDDSVEPASSQ
jgi:hypothetical protein